MNGSASIHNQKAKPRHFILISDEALQLPDEASNVTLLDVCLARNEEEEYFVVNQKGNIRTHTVIHGVRIETSSQLREAALTAKVLDGEHFARQFSQRGWS